jgi:hypothetical protein
MTTNIYDFTATPAEYKVSDEVTLALSPLSPKDIVNLTKWARERVKNAAYEEIGAISIYDRTTVWTQIAPIIGELISAELNTNEGLIRYVAVSARKNDPLVSENDLSELLSLLQLADVAMIVQAITAGQAEILEAAQDVGDLKNLRMPTPKKSAKNPQPKKTKDTSSSDC